mgnify:CR=1 FL=1
MEITEVYSVKRTARQSHFIYNLKEHGFTISMDDFGSGYSSLNLLRKVQIDTLKIDKVFIDSTEDVQRSQVICLRKLLIWHQKFTLKQSAEGVENTKVNVIS